MINHVVDNPMNILIQFFEERVTLVDGWKDSLEPVAYGARCVSYSRIQFQDGLLDV